MREHIGANGDDEMPDTPAAPDDTDPHLPPVALHPRRVYTRAEFSAYPREFNIVDELIGRQLRAGRGGHAAFRHEGGDISYQEVWDRAGRLAAVLRGLGVGEGDRVLVRCLNEPPALIANFAVLLLGAVMVPTSPLLTAGQLARILRDCEPAAVLVNGYLLPDLLAARAEVAARPPVLLFDAPAGAAEEAGCLDLDTAVAGATGAVEPVVRDGSAVSVLLYTSGLLEPARATAHRQEELLVIPDGYGRYCWDVQPDDVVAGAGPINFAGGYSTTLTLPMRFGATAAVIPLTTTPAEMFRAVKQFGVTLLAALPTRYQEMLDVPGADPADLGSLRMVSGGGEPLEAATAAGWRDRFGLQVYEGFGTNGMMHVFITTAADRRIVEGSMGRPLPGYTASVRTPDGAEAAAGEPGQLWIQGPVGTLFWGHPDDADEVAARQRATTEAGWTKVGDWVRRDDAGNLFFIAREEDLVVRAGVRFGPVEIERVLLTHPAVAEAGVYEARRAGEVPLLRALVRPSYRRGTPPAAQIVRELDELCRAQLSPERWPDRIEVVGALPRTMFGTLLRRAAWPEWLGEPAAPPSSTLQPAH